jgi:hypothetical protein
MNLQFLIAWGNIYAILSRKIIKMQNSIYCLDARENMDKNTGRKYNLFIK